MHEDIRHVLFPFLGIEDPCCVLFNPSAPAASKVHRGCIYSRAARATAAAPPLSGCTVGEVRCLRLRRRQPRNVTAHCGVQTGDNSSTPSAQEVSSRPCEEMTLDFGFSLRNEAPPEICLVTFSSLSAVVEVFVLFFFSCKITKVTKMSLADKVQQIYEEQIFFHIILLPERRNR